MINVNQNTNQLVKKLKDKNEELQKKYENKLKELEDYETKYQLITENANDMIRILNNKFQIEYINESIHEKLLGYCKEELLGKFILDFIHPEDRKNLINFVRKSLKKKEGKFQFRFKHKNGTYIWVETNGKVFKDENKSKKILTITRNIDKKKKTEEFIEKTRKKYQLIIENANDLIVIIDKNSRVEYVNERTLFNMSGYLPHDVLGKKPRDFIHPFYLNENNLFQLEKYIKDGKTTFEVPLLHKNGSYVPTELNYSKFNDENGEVKELITIRDISERKHAEQKIKESEKKFRRIFKAIPDLFFIVSSDGTFIDYNAKEIDLYVPPEKFLGKNLRDVMPPNISQKLISSIKKTSETKEPTIIEYKLQVNNQLRSFEARNLYFSKDRIATFVRDITNKDKAIEKLRRSKDLLSKAQKISHFGHWEWDIKEKRVFWSDEIYNIFQWPKNIKPKIRNWFDYIYVDDKDRVYKTITKDIRDDRIHSAELRIIRSDGVLRHLHSEWEVEKDDTGKPSRVFGTLHDITDLIIIEEKLRDSEEKHRLISENANDVILIIDQKGKINFCNKKPLFRGFGYLPEDLIGKQSREFIHPDFLENGIFPLIKYLKKGKNVVELKIKHKKGYFIDVELSASIFLDKNKKVNQLIFLRDITERKVFQKKLKESEERYRLILNNAYDLIIVINQNRGVEFANELQLYNILGYDLNEILGKRIYRLIHHDDANKVLKTAAKSYNSSINYIEGRFKHKEGHYVWLECTFKPYKDEKKEPKFLVVARDITEKKQSALKIKESEDKYKNILENIKEGYFEVDLEGNFTHVNPSFCYILGYSAKELYSRNSSEFTNRSIKKRIRNFFTKIYITELPRSNFVSPFIKKDNEMIFLEFSAYLRFNSEGNKIGFCGLIRDITDKIKAEQMIKEEVIKLKKLDYLKNEFVGRASHELKTPLVSICNASALLYELFKEELSDKAKDLVKIIMKGGERLEELVQNLIDVSRIESGKLNLNLKDVDITKIIKECIEDLYFQLKTREICIEFNKNKSVILAVDSIRFKQVIMNLLINAIKYTPPGGSISILLDKNDKNLEIKIIDDGIGFTSEEKKLIFKKFGKIERYGQGVDVISDGSGLGLYISKEIVNAHHGIIRVESEGRNKGSIFIISLPWI